MAKDITLGIQAHLNDEAGFETHRVPSAQRDFVSLQIGKSVTILLFNPAQAKALGQAVVDAHRLLKSIELDVEQAEMTKAWNPVYEGWGGYEGEELYDGDGENDNEYVDCTIDHPCSLCQDNY